MLTPFQIILETEYDNHAALSLYESLGFIREKRLYRFYLNGKDAFRLVLAVPCSDDDLDNTEAFRSRRPSRMPYRAIRVSPYSDDEDNDDQESAR
jgi:peptide alpha-N-acetyltransferase